MRTVGLFLAFALGLSGSAVALRGIAARNPSESDGLLEHLRVHGAQYDIIVIGPSYVRLHFLPELFDERLRQHGRSLRSFGFGIPEMRGPEIDYYLERIFELNLPNLKWVLCDVTLDQQRPYAATNWYKRRLVKWHEPEQFMLLPHAILNRQDATSFEKAWELSIHVRHLLLNLLNVGEGVAALQSFDSPRIRARSEFRPRIPDEKGLKRITRKYKKRRKWHLESTKQLIALRQQPPKLPQSSDLIVRFRNRIRAHGVKPLFVLSPLLRDVRIETYVPGDEPLAVLDFSDPLLYPGLYDYKLRSNGTHFHYYGAEIYTLALADRFVAHLEGRQPAAPVAEPVLEAEAAPEIETETVTDTQAEPAVEPEGEAEQEPGAEAEAENDVEPRGKP